MKSQKSKGKTSNGSGAYGIYNHLSSGNLFGIADKIKAERNSIKARKDKQQKAKKTTSPA